MKEINGFTKNKIKQEIKIIKVSRIIKNKKFLLKWLNNALNYFEKFPILASKNIEYYLENK